MAQGKEYISGDLIASSIASPMDWDQFERLAYDVLVSDDLPSLRRIGGVGDHGADAVEEVFYEAARKVVTVVQVTSAQAQKVKLKDTLEKLSRNGISTRALIFLTRHPVSASIRREMITEGDGEGVTVDIRDSDYLIGQLSKPGSPIFSRYFGSTTAQLQTLLGQADPLHAASGRLQHALLATLGAYVLSSHARMARGTLFDKTVIAAVASKGGRATRDEILQAVQELLPNEPIESQRIEATIGRLTASDAFLIEGATVVCSAETLDACVRAARSAENGFQALLKHIEDSCRSLKVNDAQLGYIERNLRKAILQLLRVSGPLKEDDDGSLDFGANASEEVNAILGRDLPLEIARSAIVSFSTFIADPVRAAQLAPLVRSYAALAMRNVDPVGRRWQEVVLSRSCIALDTDAVLYVIVEELPEHKPLLSSLSALHKQGVEILIPEHVLDEAVGHLGRAGRTFDRFADRLHRFPPEVVDGHVWHAVVRGFYYAKRAGYAGSFEGYCAKYHASDDPKAFAEHLLSKRLELKRGRLDEVPAEAEASLYELQRAVLEYRERSRMKAVFRDPAEMAQRVRADVSMALTLAERASFAIGASARGYVASSDRAFQIVETHSAWKPRQSVHIWTRGLPELASFTCGGVLTDDQSVKLLFSPVTIAAADQMKSEIGLLASIGVDLKDVPMDRLDWDLRHSLRQKIDVLELAVTNATSDSDMPSAHATLDVARAAKEIGYPVVSQVATLIEDYDSTQKSLADERSRREQLEEQMRALVAATRKQTTSKTRAKFNRLLDELGVEVDEPSEEDSK